MKRTAVLGLAVALIAPAASGQAPPDYDFDWVTVGAPGNRPTRPDQTPFWGDRPLGAVDYEFRIATKEVTADQWFEFVEAYAPYHEGAPHEPRFTGRWISTTAIPGEYVIIPGMGQRAVRVSFHYAARYINWLHNGKGPEREAFESGVYDTSTFTTDPTTGRALDQKKRSPGATFFLPTLDEWTKAAYYDPDRHGPGEEGYWLYPDGDEDPLTPGLPWEPGAETSGGTGEYMDVGQYTQSISPWGLLDVSGGEREWTETVVDGSFSRARHIKGSEYYDVGLTDLFDRLDFVLQTIPTGITGIRVASVVPAPGTLLPLVAGVAIVARRERRR